MKFGKYLEARELDLPDYNNHFIDYKGLKKLIKALALPIDSTTIRQSNEEKSIEDITENNADPFDDPTAYKRLQQNKASFFFKLERELEGVNLFYLQKESDLKLKFSILNSKYLEYKNSGKLNPKNNLLFKSIYGGFIKFQKDLINFEQYIELNKTGFSKVLKKWDKRSHSQDKEFYLATVVSVQPIFTRLDTSKLNDDTLNVLIELNDLRNNYNENNTDTFTDISDIKNIKTEYISNVSGSSPKITINDNNNPNSLTFSDFPITTPYIDTDFEIENWFSEIFIISKLKDDGRRINALESFFPNKIERFFNDNKVSLLNRNDLLTESLSKLFIRLINSPISDIDLNVFYDSIKKYLNLAFIDEDEQIFSKRNVYHEATHCTSNPRTFIISEALVVLPNDVSQNLINSKDIQSRTPLHYAAELGKSEIVTLLLNSNIVIDTINDTDNDGKTPLMLSVISNQIGITRRLLSNETVSLSFHRIENLQRSPLITACTCNSYEALKLMLDVYRREMKDLNNIHDTQGLGPLHIVAKNNNGDKLIKLLIQYGANPNIVDEFNSYTPIFYAIKGRNPVAVKELLINGADLSIVDDENKSPLFYALWEGNVGVLNELLPFIDNQERITHFNKQLNPSLNAIVPVLSDDILLSADEDFGHLDDSLDNIPDFALPPPIIPLRKYGHSYLEENIFIKLIINSSKESIKLYTSDDSILIPEPGRITINSNSSHILSRSIVLKNLDQDVRVYEGNEVDNGEVIFQVNSLDKFMIDFEVYPEFGTRLIAKTTAMPFLFKRNIHGIEGEIHLPLFDSRLNNIGSLNFRTQIIFPYEGKPLQIIKYEPYWKSTSNSTNKVVGTGINPNKITDELNSNKTELHYITSSSLIGTFITMRIFSLKDGTLVVAPKFWINIQGSKFLLIDLTREQLENFCGYNIEDITADDVSHEDGLLNIIRSRVVDFSKILSIVPHDFQLVIQVCFPTLKEVDNVPVRIPPKISINEFIDNILFVVFEHERTLRHSGELIRSISFSSCNWQVCAILNWKQPNFPVLLQMNTILRQSNGKFISDTPHHLADLVTEYENINREGNNHPIYEDNGDICIRDMIRFAANNNVFGVIIPNSILELCESLVSTIKGQELLLIGSLDGDVNKTQSHEYLNGFYEDFKLIVNNCNE